MAEKPPTDQESLLQENAALKAKVEDYKRLEEDLIAKRVFEKARGYLTTWITLGGVILTLATFVGYNKVIGYFTELAKTKADAITDEEMHKIVAASVDVRVDIRVAQAIPEIKEQVFKRVTQSAEPLVGAAAATENTSASASSAQQTKSSIDWSGDMSAPRDSGNEGSTVGLALATTLEFYIFKATGSHIAISGRDIYNEVREREGWPSEDIGAFIKDGIKFLKTTGAVEERAWPYHAGEYNQPPPTSLRKEKRYKISDAKQIVTLDEMKTALNSGPAIAGITVYRSVYDTQDVAKTGIIPMPKPKEEITGGHSVCLVGYDDKKKMLKFQNCWGTDWGDHGYGYLPYDYFREQSSDCWTFRYASH
jgi:C1A family cysteine protease